LIWSALCVAAFGQTGNATLTGTIQDNSGAVIPGAHIVLTNGATGVQKVAESNGAGIYFIPTLPPGTYKLEVTASGFQTKIVSDIKLNVDQHASIDVQLLVGATKQEVTVSGTTIPVLQTVDATVGTTVQSQQINDLPLNGRSFTQLEQLTAGAVKAIHTGSYGASNGNANPLTAGLERNLMPAYDMNGQTAESTFFQLDGIENNEREFGGANIAISVDAIQEFKVQTADFSAEYGRSQVQVDVVTKGGTNQFHGDAFEFVRNDAFDAAQWEFTGPHVKNNLKRNQFGGTIGGPIKKDKLFFFFSYDGTREIYSDPLLESVPTQAMRQGDFPAGDIIFNPTTQQPFANNVVPQGSWNTISQKVLPFMPAPNIAGTSNLSKGGLQLPDTNNYYYVPYRDESINQYNGRVDYNRSEKNTIFARYTLNALERVGDGPLATNIQGSIINDERANLGGTNLSAGWYHNFNASTINELRGGFSTDPEKYLKGNNTDYPSQFGINSFLFHNYLPGFPTFVIGSVTLGSGEYRPLTVSLAPFEINDTLTKIKGTHTLRVGGEYRRQRNTVSGDDISSGLFEFNGAQTRNRAYPTTGTTPCPGASATNGCSAGNGWADFLLGDLELAEDGQPFPQVHDYFSNFAGFVNDTWRVRKTFTVNLGLRYEYQTRIHHSPYWQGQPIITNNQFTGIVGVETGSNGQIPSTVSQQAINLEPAGSVISCKAAGLPDNCLISQKNGWQPRIGFAWQVTPKTVIRAGAGYYQEVVLGNFDTQSCQTYPMVLLQSTPNNTAPPSGTAAPPLNFSNPFTSATPPKPTFANCAQPNRKLPSSGQWNFTAERAITPSTTLTVAYVANAGRHLENSVTGQIMKYNIPGPIGVVLAPGVKQTTPQPGFGIIQQYQDITTNSYQSLQVTLKRRVARSLTFTAFYTYSKNLTYASYFSDFLDTKVDKGPWGDDLTNSFVLSPIWQLPFGQGQRWRPGNAVLNKLASGWEVNTIISDHGGFPFNPVLSPNVDLLHQNGYNTQNRPNNACNSKLTNPTAAQWYNPSCFVVPTEPTTPGAALVPGNTGWDSLRGPSGFSEDVGIFKRTPITENKSLEIRAEFFNVWNHPILGLPSPNINPAANVATEGQITSPDSLSRVIQLAAKFYF
jgi:hypothetical protein